MARALIGRGLRVILALPPDVAAALHHAVLPRISTMA
jgi:hypothetical protein